MGTNNWF